MMIQMDLPLFADSTAVSDYMLWTFMLSNSSSNILAFLQLSYLITTSQTREEELSFKSPDVSLVWVVEMTLKC